MRLMITLSADYIFIRLSLMIPAVTKTCCKMKQVLKHNDYEKLLPIIVILAEKGEISSVEAVAVSGKSRTTVWRYLQKLVDAGVVEDE